MQESEGGREALVDTRATQFLKGTLDMCLLALLARQPCYGYEIVQQLARHGLHPVSEGSIYPLLSRLQQHGLIEGYLSPQPMVPRANTTASCARAPSSWRTGRLSGSCSPRWSRTS